jgi:hypothetical protein
LFALRAAKQAGISDEIIRAVPSNESLLMLAELLPLLRDPPSSESARSTNNTMFLALLHLSKRLGLVLVLLVVIVVLLLLRYVA